MHTYKQNGELGYLYLEIYLVNFTVALEASLLGQMFTFRTIFQPWALSSDSPAEKGLFPKYVFSIISELNKEFPAI